MVLAGEVVDEHFGMIGKGAAEKIAGDRTLANGARMESPVEAMSEIAVDDVIRERARVNSLVEMSAQVYRVYNRKVVEIDGRDVEIRIIILGTQGENIRAILFEEKVALANSMPIERGDVLHLVRFVVRRGYNGLELASLLDSRIEKISSSASEVANFSMLRNGQKDVDVIGRIVAIGPVKHSIFSIGRGNDACNCTISDGKTQMRLTVIGNAVHDLSLAHPGDPIKIEFCAVRDEKELYANESSRILVSAALRPRLC
ncbi:MAG: hypothetical protein KGH61_04115 [Candidatus Micrarchaeota archaeon]|nr:hypothetical protein [Candidatus Micrarchaeota archaeon]MDE1848106.1 hypothetical protein [Candidatus Micrarchaeota archaeon]MDE1864766.1 hypothetical protein [Candidatus Micrarchaeota archaeon]